MWPVGTNPDSQVTWGRRAGPPWRSAHRGGAALTARRGTLENVCEAVVCRAGKPTLPARAPDPLGGQATLLASGPGLGWPLLRSPIREHLLCAVRGPGPPTAQGLSAFQRGAHRLFLHGSWPPPSLRFKALFTADRLGRNGSPCLPGPFGITEGVAPGDPTSGCGPPSHSSTCPSPWFLGKLVLSAAWRRRPLSRGGPGWNWAEGPPGPAW